MKRWQGRGVKAVRRRLPAGVRTRRWPWLLLLVLAGVGAWLGWRALWRPPAEALAASSPSALAAAWLRPAVTDAASSAASGAASGPPGPSAGADEEAIEVCGVGRVTRQQVEAWSALEEAGMKAKAQVLDRRRQAVLSQLSARLAAGSDSQRVAARLLMDDVEGAAHVAARSSDGAAYRLARLGCSRWDAAQAPSCRSLTTQAWRQLNPQDARPWADLMVEAWRRKDEGAAAQALDEMLLRRPQGSGSPLLDALVSARGVVVDDEALGLLVVEVIGRDAAFPREELGAFSRYCSAERLKIPAHAQRCERLARWQLAHAADLTDAMLATALADRAGLPAAQRPFTREQLQLGQERFLAHSLAVIGPDCRSLRRTVDWAARRVELGELRMALQAAADR